VALFVTNVVRGRYGSLTSPLEAVRGVGSTAPARPMLLATCILRRGPSWPQVTSRPACSPSGVRSLTSDSYFQTHSGSGWYGHLSGKGEPAPLGVGRGEARALGVGLDGARALEVGHDGALALGVGRDGARALGAG